MIVNDVIQAVEAFAPGMYQEGYDNSGLQIGNGGMEVKGILVSLDVTEDILREAQERGCNMVVAHHPLLFSGLKRIAGRNYIERIVESAIKKDIAIYAAHTNLDNMRGGVNAKIAERLGLQNTAILSMRMDTLRKLYTFAPQESADKVRQALFAAGALAGHEDGKGQGEHQKGGHHPKGGTFFHDLPERKRNVRHRTCRGADGSGDLAGSVAGKRLG